MNSSGKRDAEVKLLLGCTSQDIETIVHFNEGWMRYLFIPNPAIPDQKEEK